MAHLEHEGHRREGQLRHRPALEHGIKKAKDDEENHRNDESRLKLREGEIARGFLEAGLDPINLLHA